MEINRAKRVVEQRKTTIACLSAYHNESMLSVQAGGGDGRRPVRVPGEQPASHQLLHHPQCRRYV